MGIQDRDYMRRPSGDDGHEASSADKLEKFVSGFLARHPRFFFYAGICLAILILAALVVVKVAGASR